MLLQSIETYMQHFRIFIQFLGAGGMENWPDPCFLDSYLLASCLSDSCLSVSCLSASCLLDSCLLRVAGLRVAGRRVAGLWVVSLWVVGRRVAGLWDVAAEFECFTCLCTQDLIGSSLRHHIYVGMA